MERDGHVPDGTLVFCLIPIRRGVVVRVGDAVDDEVGHVTVSVDMANGGQSRKEAGDLAQTHVDQLYDLLSSYYWIGQRDIDGHKD